MSHMEKCRVHAFSHADTLIMAINEKRMNASAFEGLMESYLSLPAFSSCRETLLTECLARLDRA